ncbi:MAG: hypothetical protein WC869_01420 [Phycisphaerae bacterium]|jgi:hypothetical protein
MEPVKQTASQPTPPPLPGDTGQSPLSESHFSQIRQALAARQGARKTYRVAHSSAVITLVIGVLAVVSSVASWSLFNLTVSLAVCAVGAVEYHGAKRVRRSDALATRLLGFNQLAFLAVIIVYCIVQMFSKDMQLSPEFRDALAQLPGKDRGINDMVGKLAFVVYGLVIVLSIGFQGGMSLYYFTRGKSIAAANQTTAAWISRLLTLMDQST